MKALIIGGAGFVGAYLMRYLKEELHMEVTVTKMPQEQIEAENVKVCDLDILKKDDITGLFKAEQPDWIFHFPQIKNHLEMIVAEPSLCWSMVSVLDNDIPKFHHRQQQ